MKEDKNDMANTVEQLLKAPSVPEKKEWWKCLDWRKQLMALVNLIPCAGGAIATEIETILNSMSNYKAYEFFRKFTRFIYSLDDITEEEKLEFLEDLEKEGDDSSGNIILSMVDRLDNINKQTILANLLISRVKGLISMQDFFRLSSVLERIPYVDLRHLANYQEEFYDENGDTELLYSTGVLRPSQFSSNGDKYILSPLGVKLLKCGLDIHVDVPKLKGADTGPTWDEISEIPPDEEEVKRIVNKTIDNRIYEESDQAMFDLDFVRGK